MKFQTFTFLYIFLCLYMPVAVFAGDDYLFSPKGIAEVHITLHDGKTIEDIRRDEPDETVEKLKATMVIKNSASSIYESSDLYNGLIEIKGRGNTTWGRPKKPYSIDLIDDAGENNPAPLLGMPSEEEWILIAYWNDRSYMRIPLAYWLGERMNGLAYSPRTRYVEVFINGEYRGVYSLVEKIKRDKNRVNISKLTGDDSDMALPQISGGYIVEVIPHDRVKLKERNTEFRTSRRGINFVFKYPKPKNAVPRHVSWIKSYLDEFESVIYGSNFTDPENGYLKYIDEDSFIDWCILHELSKGVDNLFHCSVFVHKDRNGKLNMSAPWDFDISFGNVNGDCYSVESFRMPNTHWYNQLFKDIRFKQKLVDRYDELLPLFDQIPDILEANYNFLEETGCLERDNQKYPAILTEYKDHIGNTTPTTVSGHVQWLEEWIDARKKWMYINYGMTTDDQCERLKNTSPTLRIINPEGFTGGESSYVYTFGGFKYYDWDGETSVWNLPSKKIDDDEEHWVTIRDLHGCSSLPSKIIRRGYNGTSIQNHAPKVLSVHCTYIGRQLHIGHHSLSETELEVILYDIRGTVVVKNKYQSFTGHNSHILDTPDIPKGIYIVRCCTSQDNSVQKISIGN